MRFAAEAQAKEDARLAGLAREQERAERAAREEAAR